MLRIRSTSKVFFYDEIHNELAEVEAAADHQIITGGDFNVIFDPDLDGTGGKPKLKESSKKNMENLCSSFELIDIWRIRNPGAKRFSFSSAKRGTVIPNARGWEKINLQLKRLLPDYITKNGLPIP